MGLVATSKREVNKDPQVDPEQIARPKGRLPQFGVAIFDNYKDPMGGWACLADGESFRFRSVNDLKSDCIWICAVEGFEFSRRFNGMHHLRPTEYFRSTLRHISADIGLHVDGEGRWGNVAEVAAPTLAKLAQRVALIAAQSYQWQDPSRVMANDSLNEDIRKSLGAGAPIRDYMRTPLQKSLQTYSAPSMTAPYEHDTVSVTLRLNRFKHAQNILQTPIPDGAWVYVDQQMSVDAALNPQRPCIVEVAIETMDSDNDEAALIAFGAQLGKRSGIRNWMCQRELEWISKYARVTISRGYLAANTNFVPEHLQLPRMLTADPVFELSVSAGLIAECHWTALSTAVFNPKIQDAERKEISPMGVWLRAADRALSFDLALKVHRAGFFVLGYGNGCVVTRCPRDRLPQLLDFAAENDVAHPTFLEVFETNGLS